MFCCLCVGNRSEYPAWHGAGRGRHLRLGQVHPRQPPPQVSTHGVKQRRRINTEKKVKVVAGAEFIIFHAALAILPRTILKNRMNSSFSFKSSRCNYSYYSIVQYKTASAARNWINSALTKHKRRPSPFHLSSSFIYGVKPQVSHQYCAAPFCRLRVYTFWGQTATNLNKFMNNINSII